MKRDEERSCLRQTVRGSERGPRGRRRGVFFPRRVLLLSSRRSRAREAEALGLVPSLPSSSSPPTSSSARQHLRLPASRQQSFDEGRNRFSSSQTFLNFPGSKRVHSAFQLDRPPKVSPFHIGETRQYGDFYSAYDTRPLSGRQIQRSNRQLCFSVHPRPPSFVSLPRMDCRERTRRSLR